MKPLVISASFFLAVCCFTRPAMSLELQPLPVQRATPVDVSAQIARLEQMVASLQQQVAMLQSVIRISVSGVEINSSKKLTLNAAQDVDIHAGSDTWLKSNGKNLFYSSGDTYIKAINFDVSSRLFRLSGGRGNISASSDMSIKGAVLKLNKGTKPVATIGSMIANNQVVTGSPTIFGE